MDKKADSVRCMAWAMSVSCSCGHCNKDAMPFGYLEKKSSSEPAPSIEKMKECYLAWIVEEIPGHSLTFSAAEVIKYA